MFPNRIYYESESLNYPLGQLLKETYKDIPWYEIDSHNKIDQLRQQPNSQFPHLKQHLIIGIRKTHKYTPNYKVSDFLVPFTSSGCTAMCLYCYLVCNYNKCAYLRLFVNREEILDKLMRHAARSSHCLTYEIGSNSDLVLENTITGNLPWAIEQFSKSPKGKLTFPTKFHMIQPLLPLDHQGRVIIRMSVNPDKIIRQVELGTSDLFQRIQAINQLCDAGYPIGLLIAPVILLPDWKTLYQELITQLSDLLSPKVKQTGFIEIIFMTYSFVQNAINTEAFPLSQTIYQKEQMTGRGRGKYCYKQEYREEGEEFLRHCLGTMLPEMKILYVV